MASSFDVGCSADHGSEWSESSVDPADKSDVCKWDRPLADAASHLLVDEVL
jgi:hypothetical protein